MPRNGARRDATRIRASAANGLVQADLGSKRVVGTVVDVEHVLRRLHEGGISLRRDAEALTCQGLSSFF